MIWKQMTSDIVLAYYANINKQYEFDIYKYSIEYVHFLLLSDNA